MMRPTGRFPFLTKRPVAIAMAIGVVAAGVILVARTRFSHQAIHATATYYCPMHPRIVKDRPGECPICYMKLVKRDDAPPSAPPQQQTAQQMKDICYMHNCPMAKAGKPCPMLVVAKAGEKVTCPVCGTHVTDAAATSGAQGKKILYWTDPMIPGYKSDKPGTSPMGMELTPVYEETGGGDMAAPADAPDGYAPILVTPQKQQLIGVKTAAVERRALRKTVRAVGTVAHDPELYQAQQEFIEAQQAWERAQATQMPEVVRRAQRLIESSKLRMRHLGLSEEMIEEMGAWTEPDHRLLLGGAGQYWVYAAIYEYELPLVQPGQAVSIEASAFPSQPFAGTVKAIDPMLDQMTRTVRVRILVEDPEGKLKPAMYVNVLIEADLGDVVTAPKEAIFATGTRYIAFVDQGHGVFEPRDVKVGAKTEDTYEILAGLREGEVVVTSGNFLIDSESRLKAALDGMTQDAQPGADAAGGGHSHGP
jgi:multidrug efflux pump subunit AcrA (membrane-fusion protein)